MISFINDVAGYFWEFIWLGFILWGVAAFEN